MKWRELFEGLFRPAAGDEFQQWEPTLQRTRQLLEARDFRTLTDLVREHRHSELLTRGIGLEMMARLPQILTSPDAAARHEVLQLMDALRRTPAMKHTGRKLANLPGNSSHPIHGVLALHTLLVDAYPERHPESRMQQPTTGEVQAAMRLVDRLFRTGIFRELCRMTEAPTRMEPPFYVARLYGWDVDCEILQAMRHERDATTPGADPRRIQQLREEIFRTENHLVRGAERTIEGMTEMPVPRSYVERLESELNTLGWLARAPERIDDPHTSRQFLDKYEIHPGLPPEAQRAEAEAAFRELDARLVQLTGREARTHELDLRVAQPEREPGRTSFRREYPAVMQPSEAMPRKLRH